MMQTIQKGVDTHEVSISASLRCEKAQPFRGHHVWQQRRGVPDPVIHRRAAFVQLSVCRFLSYVRVGGQETAAREE